MCGIYGLSGGVVFGTVGNIPYGPIRNCGLSAVAIPRTRKRDCKKVLLAINRIGNHHRRIWNNIDVLSLVPRWHIDIPVRLIRRGNGAFFDLDI